MSVHLAFVVKALAVIDAVRLCLSLEAECAVSYLLYAALKIGAVTKEVADIELNAGLIGVYRELKVIVPYLSRKSGADAEEFLKYRRREEKIVVVAYEIIRKTLADPVRHLEIEDSAEHARSFAIRDKIF